MKPIFITGIGTGIGKTVAAAIVTEALGARYWKPVQAGFEDGTDANAVAGWLSHPEGSILPSLYTLVLPASPHIAARQEGRTIAVSAICDKYAQLATPTLQAPMVIEGAGGLLVPLNENEFVLDLIKQLQARVILVSRNYLGSINHSLLTAAVCRQHGLDVAGWLFNDQYLHYEDEIVQWSGYPKIGTIPAAERIGKTFVQEQAMHLQERLSRIV